MGKVFRCGQVVVEHGLVPEIADALPLVWGTAQLCPIQGYLTGIRLDERSEDAKQGGFAGAVSPDQHTEIAIRQGDR